MSKDVIIDLVDILDQRLTLTDIQQMSAGDLKVVSNLLINWSELVRHEQDTRSSRGEMASQTKMEGTSVTTSTGTGVSEGTTETK